MPTLADSNSSGFHYSVFMARALTSTPTTYYDSPADSGHSVDNLPPVLPAVFTAAYVSGATHLHGGANSEPDLWYYRVYRGAGAEFVPGPGNLIPATADTGYVDEGAAGSYDKLSAVDVNGNESAYTTLTPAARPVSRTAGRWRSHEPSASPTCGGRLGVSFTLPAADSARVELLDVGGAARGGPRRRRGGTARGHAGGGASLDYVPERYEVRVRHAEAYATRRRVWWPRGIELPPSIIPALSQLYRSRRTQASTSSPCSPGIRVSRTLPARPRAPPLSHAIMSC